MDFMDMLFKRYACPFPMLDETIASCRLHEFICHLISTINQENKEKVQWDFYLHKVFDKSYEKYLESIEPLPDLEETPANLEEQIKETMEIFNIELI